MRTAKIYIDGANIFYAQKKVGWSLDWAKVKAEFETERTIAQWRYYVGLKSGDDPMQNYLKYLDAIGFTAFTKPLKSIKVSGPSAPPSGIIYKANFDVEMTADILLDKSKLDEVIIFSGDSDFAYLVKKLRDTGTRVTIFAFRKTIAWELKLAATKVIYLDDLKSDLQRLK